MQKVKKILCISILLICFIVFHLCICGGVLSLFHVSDEIYQHDGATACTLKKYNDGATATVQHATDKIATAQAKLSQNKRAWNVLSDELKLQKRLYQTQELASECQSRLSRCQELLERRKHL